jgi:hypothetical protein
MIRILTDEDFNGRIVRGLLLRKRDLDLVRVQDTSIAGADDAALLRWAEENDRVLLTHDSRTMPRHFRDHLSAGRHAPGVFIVDDLAPIAKCIDDVLLIAECSEQDEWQDQIYFLPWQ